LAALQRSLGNFLFERLGNGILEAIFLGQAARADQHVYQEIFHILFLRSFWAKDLKKLRHAAWFVSKGLIFVITVAASIIGHLGRQGHNGLLSFVPVPPETLGDRRSFPVTAAVL
jgi:hypothetical protein